MTTCFHKYTPPEGQTQVIARAQSISLIRCLFRLKCKFTEPLYKSAWYTLLSLLIFSTYALSIKREGHNLKKKKKKGNIAVAAVVAFLCGYALKSAVLRYCGYRDSPSHNITETSRNTTKLAQHNGNKPQQQNYQRKQATTQRNQHNTMETSHNTTKLPAEICHNTTKLPAETSHNTIKLAQHNGNE